MDVSEFYLSSSEVGNTRQFTELALAERVASNIVRMWAVRPKSHSHTHVIYVVASTRLNPRFFHCFGDEDYVGRIGRLSARCHPTTQSLEALTRYLAGSRLRRLSQAHCGHVALEGKEAGTNDK